MANNALTSALSRQKGLMNELSTVANNIANANTAGYRSEGMVFTEYVKALSEGESLSMTRTGAKTIDLTQGALVQTDDPLDFAIEGEGFFTLETQAGPRLTRAGGFALNNQGEIVDSEGRRLFGQGNSPITIPPGTVDIIVSRDGVVEADGVPVGQLAVVTAPVTELMREGDNMFRAENGFEPSQAFSIMQGAVENSNVNVMGEFSRMIEVTRTYEGSKSFMDKESERLKRMIELLGQPQS
ncbi:MAG: flagellar basal-body rod protein FlgF [Pseudomonadota bacterium]